MFFRRTDAPRCAVAPTLRGVALLEPADVTCRVDADPANVTFRWTFNDSVRRDRSQVLDANRYTQEGLRSTLSYTPKTERDYGTLLCFAINAVGRQREACSFTLISAGPPEQVTNCSAVHVTSHSAQISCLPSFDGGLPQRFLLQVREAEGGGLLVVNSTGPSPVFLARPLESGRSYSASVVAFNSRGRARPATTLLLTLKEAEMHKSLPSMVEPSPLVLIMGVVAGVLVVVGALLLALWLVRERRSHALRDATVTQIVLKDNNPDLLSVEASEEVAAIKTNGSIKTTVYATTAQSPEVSGFRRYDEGDDDAASLYGSSSSPEATERTRLTPSSNSSSKGAHALRGKGGAPSPPSAGGLEGTSDLRRQTTVRLFMSGSPEASF